MSLHCIVWCCRVLYCWLRRAGCISQDTYLLYFWISNFGLVGQLGSQLGWWDVLTWDPLIRICWQELCSRCCTTGGGIWILDFWFLILDRLANWDPSLGCLNLWSVFADTSLEGAAPLVADCWMPHCCFSAITCVPSMDCTSTASQLFTLKGNSK